MSDIVSLYTSGNDAVNRAGFNEKFTEINTNAVPTARKINNKTLISDISLTAADVGARPDTWTPTPGEIGAATVAVYTATLTAAGWSQTAPYTQTVSIEGIGETDSPIFGPAYTGTNDEKIAQCEAWNMVNEADTASGAVTFTCFEDKPGVDINIQIKAVR